MGVSTGDNGGGAVWRSTKKRSLVISPNLDKLLEHEEWSRRSNTRWNSIEAPMGSATITVPTGLPPPPRRNRQCSTPLSRRSSAKKSDTSSVVGRETLSVQSSNPYINPAPTTEELFPSSHPVPVPEPSQQSISVGIDDQQNSSFCSRIPATRCFRAAKEGKFAVSPILANSPDHARTLENDLSSANSSTVKYFGFSSAARATPSGTHDSLDPTPHRMSVISSHPDRKLDNQASSHMSSLSTTHPMTTSPAGSPTLEYGVKPSLPATPPLSRHSSLLKKRSALNNLQTNVKPATTNFLDEVERADLVRKSRKLARLFGETPNAEAVVYQAGLVPAVLANGKDSGPDNPQVIPPHRDRPGPDGATAFSRRYSLPLRVEDIPPTNFSTAVDAGNLGSWSDRPSSSPVDRTVQSNSIRSSSAPVIELSDDRSSTFSVSSSNTVSLLENERRRKRQRLAKLYRFLGSRVPINLVLGINDATASLPPRDNTETRPTLLRRRRSSSAIPILSTWSNEVERLKADLDDREKAIIVRRAQKMEKLFGVAPPLTLYYPHSASAPSSGSATPSTTPLSRADGFLSYTSSGLKSSKQKDGLPATPESSKQLLPKRTDSFGSFARFDSRSAQACSNGHSTFYNHYEHSLHSLNDIIDRDDKASLAELHQALYGDIVPHDPSGTFTYGLDEEDGTTTPIFSGRRSSTSSVLPRSERREAFPARTSMISLDSEYSFSLPSQASSFQQRRKRAAKLTHFFGVDYRELFDDVLESLANDMQVGQSEGVLRTEEAEDLLQKLRKLKYKRHVFL